MKTKTSLFIVSILAVFVIYACDSNEGPDSNPPYNDSYIQKFTDVTQISAKAGFGISVNKDDKIVDFYTGTTYIPKDLHILHILVEAKSTEGFYSADAPKTTNEYQEYNKLISKLDDTGFKKKDRFYGVLNTTSVAITDTLSSIIVTCDKEYCSIPANTNLNSLITVVFDNPYVVVRNNYKNYEGADSYTAYNIRSESITENFMIADFPYAFVGGNLSLMDWKTKPFIGNQWLLIFNQNPELSDTYTFKIKVTKLNGEMLEAMTEPIKL